MSRVYNFSAGPAALPEAVLRQAADEMLDWHGAGCGVMEMSHRGKEFTAIVEAAEADFREASAAGLAQLKGHKSVGGMRASIYNAMPLAGVQALVDYMREFAQQHG